ncbi:hypothetical protein K490DRAFT_62404 [Saccharata proteae CBS 121410]|uniref:Cora-domain-containing protein n=1 Tax=Saccharata proteae CBS 121410 TaxID=1314787 RepID=A0A9P4LXZ4_9PEZI|nr:hypothetical protein K490DRAFT_62404 [Saccharata proteae CBS 121410]
MGTENHTTQSDGDRELEKKLSKYRERAQAAALRILKPTTRHPWKDIGAYETRVHIKEFQGDHPKPPKKFETQSQEFMYYQRRSEAGSSQKPNRRLIIVENLDPRFGELLGVELDIPPEFFLAHCNEHVIPSVTDKVYGKQGSSTYWKMPIPEKRDLQYPVTLVEPDDIYVVQVGCYDRSPTVVREKLTQIQFRDKVTQIQFRGQVSCWSTRYGKGLDSWTTVLLVDPAKARLKFNNPAAPKGSKEPMELVEWIPESDVCPNITNDPTASFPLQSWGTSMFDNVVEALHHAKLSSIGVDPFSASAYARNIIYANWEHRLRSKEVQLSRTVTNDQKEHMSSEYERYTLGTTAKHEDTVRAYQHLMSVREEIKERSSDLRRIIDVFHFAGLRYLAVNEKRLEHAPRPPHPIERERIMWTFLRDRYQTMEGIISEHMEMYSQRAALTESFAANSQARSSGQLTKIATVIVPCTFVASIFSMGGDFAVGEKDFGTYWAISIPVTFVLLCWVLHEDIQQLWETLKARRQQLKTKREGPKYGEQRFLRKKTRGESSDVEKGDVAAMIHVWFGPFLNGPYSKSS